MHHISIHAPREGRDGKDGFVADPAGISIHAPREGRDEFSKSTGASGSEFQSTRPAMGATVMCGHCGSLCRHFNPRAPRGARLNVSPGNTSSQKFQSTRPARGATSSTTRRDPSALHFNPRAPRGARLYFPCTSFSAFYFNPRAPCGARLILPTIVILEL